MEEHLADCCLKASEALHWLGQYRVANVLVYVSRLARCLNLVSLDDLQDFVEEKEADAQSDVDKLGPESAKTKHPAKPEGD